jgi:hypothetical protein
VGHILKRSLVVAGEGRGSWTNTIDTCHILEIVWLPKKKPREHLEFTGFSAEPAPANYFMRIICFVSAFPSPASSGEGDNKKEHPLGEGSSDEITRSPLRWAILFLFNTLLSVRRHRESIELSCIVIQEK